MPSHSLLAGPVSSATTLVASRLGGGKLRISWFPKEMAELAGAVMTGHRGGVAWDGDSYQQRFDVLASQGQDVHGEASFVMGLSPASVLDAGCGTGRVAIELARRGVAVVGVDHDPSMLATARRLGPDVTWVEADVASPDLDLGATFAVVVMAGNVVLFTPPGSQAALVAGCARHVAVGGALVAGFQLGRGYEVDAYDEHCQLGGLELAARWATWDRRPWPGDGNYAVSVHRRPASHQ